MISASLTVTLLVISVVIYKIVQWIQRRRKIHRLFVKYGIPGPKPRFLDGSFLDLRATGNLTEIISSWLKKHGPVFGYFVGSEPFLVISDLEVLKQVFIKDFSNFVNRSDLYMDTDPFWNSMVGNKDQKWKDVRSILGPTFSGRKIRLMSKIMNRQVATTLKMVKKHSDRGVDFDIYDITKNLTLDVIAECALAMNVDSQTNPKDPFKLAMQDFINNVHNKIVELSIMFPVISYFFNFAARFITLGQVNAMVMKNLEQVINYRRAHPEAKKKIDLLQIMLDSADADPEGDTSKRPYAVTRLTNAELIANAYLFLIAGFETTSTALAFTFWLLVHHPEVQERLYEEVQQNCKADEEELSYECVQGMQYLEQVFSESMRLYPPVTAFITRVAQKECTIGQITIPKGVSVLAPIWDIHRDPDIWPEPTEFDPERFSPENKAQMHSMAYLPFGAGPRYCIGNRFAQLQAKLALAHLIRKFKFVKGEKTEKEMTIISPVLNINPANGVYLKAIPREQ